MVTLQAAQDKFPVGSAVELLRSSYVEPEVGTVASHTVSTKSGEVLINVKYSVRKTFIGYKFLGDSAEGIASCERQPWSLSDFLNKETKPDTDDDDESSDGEQKNAEDVPPNDGGCAHELAFWAEVTGTELEEGTCCQKCGTKCEDPISDDKMVGAECLSCGLYVCLACAKDLCDVTTLGKPVVKAESGAAPPGKTAGLLQVGSAGRVKVPPSFLGKVKLRGKQEELGVTNVSVAGNLRVITLSLQGGGTAVWPTNGQQQKKTAHMFVEEPKELTSGSV